LRKRWSGTQIRADVNRFQRYEARAGTVVKVYGQGHLNLF
jgi:hypothetical protein